MFFSPKAWLTIVGLCFAMLGILLNWETGFPAIGYFSGDDAQIRNTLAQRAAQHVVLELSQTPILGSGRPSVAVAMVVDDYRGTVTNQLKTWMERRNVTLVADSRFATLLKMFHRRPNTVSEAIAPYLDGAADYIIAADVDNWTTYPEYQAKLIGTVYLFDKHGEQLASIPLAPEGSAPYLNISGGSNSTSPAAENMESSPTYANYEHAGKREVPSKTRGHTIPRVGDTTNASQVHATLLPGLQFGIMAWIAFVILGPWLFQSQIKRILYRRDNGANAKMLLAWGGTCGGVLWLLMTLGGLSTVTSMVSLLAAILSCSYFAYVCEKIEANC